MIQTTKKILGEATVDATLNGVELHYTRRRYSNCTFTWVEWWNGTEWKSCGDPWPCINPPHKQIKQAIELCTS